MNGPDIEQAEPENLTNEQEGDDVKPSQSTEHSADTALNEEQESPYDEHAIRDEITTNPSDY